MVNHSEQNLDKLFINVVPDMETYEEMKSSGQLSPNQPYFVADDSQDYATKTEVEQMVEDAIEDIDYPVDSVNGRTGKVTVKEVPADGTNGQVLKKTSNGYGWSNESDPVFTASAAYGITATNISNWNGKGTYSKPSGGIPKNDLSSDVQTSLGKADSALQSYTETDPTVPSWAKQSTKPTYTASEVGLGNVPNVTTDNQTPTFSTASSRANIASGEKLSTIFGKIAKWFSDLGSLAFKSSVAKTDLASAVQTSLGKADTAYQKPSDGISKSDLASSVQTSLGKADSALQSYTETDPVFSASAAHGISSSDISAWNAKGSYSKPSGGIPKTDLSSAVQTSLDKADSAIPSSEKGANNGVATLDNSGKIPTTQIKQQIIISSIAPTTSQEFNDMLWYQIL